MIVPVNKNDTYKMLIELDENKIERESKYSVEDLKYAITKTFLSVNIKFQNGYYICKKYESVLAALNCISRREWIYGYISKWNLYRPNGKIEDLLR